MLDKVLSCHFFLFAIYLDDLSQLCVSGSSSHIILYADDILLTAPRLSKLECILHAFESELTRLDMTINCNQSCCLRVGTRCDAVCGNIVSVAHWHSELSLKRLSAVSGFNPQTRQNTLFHD